MSALVGHVVRAWGQSLRVLRSHALASSQRNRREIRKTATTADIGRNAILSEVARTSEASGYCPRCKAYKVFGPSRCNCRRFECGQPWKDEVTSWHEVYGMDAEDAAEKCAEEFDSDGDYTIIKHGSGEIWTRDENGLVQKWDIEAEAVPSYSARQKQ